MEWVETTAKSVDEAQELALDRLGVGADEAEFEVLEEPRSGLFGRMRGEARVRARVKPAAVRPKQERRNRGRNQKKDGKTSSRGGQQRRSASGNGASSPGDATAETGNGDGDGGSGGGRPQQPAPRKQPKQPKQPKQSKQQKEQRMEKQQSDVTPQEVGDAAVAFMSELASAFGVEGAATDLEVDGTDLDVRVTGGEVGLMVGPGGRTLAAIQDLARVASQRRLGDHETRLRIDVGGYREKRRAALEQFAATVAAQVIETGEPKALEPMSSSDRKAVHDAIIEIDGVTSRSEGDDPRRRVVITPA